MRSLADNQADLHAGPGALGLPQNPPVTTGPAPRPHLNPSRVELPQRVSPGRQRGRGATRRQQQQIYQLVPDAEPIDDAQRRPLPPSAKTVDGGPNKIGKLPPDVSFAASQKAQLGLAKLSAQTRNAVTRLRTSSVRFDRAADYDRLYMLLHGDQQELGLWDSDDDFAHRRISGVNPMRIRVLRDDSSTALWQEAERVLAQQGGAHPTMKDLFRDDRLYVLEYPELWHPSIQREVARRAPRDGRPANLAAPTCLFQEDEGRLRPLAIQLKPASVAGHNPVVTPLHPRDDWRLARMHVASADAHVHEGVYHLLETHLFNEAVALCMYRWLHPDHPLRQLLTPHYQGTLAINDVARGDLLSTAGAGGPIQQAMAAGATGVLNAARLDYSTWSFRDRQLQRDLKDRGLLNDRLICPYRDDALRIYDALSHYVNRFLRVWYHTDADVRLDYELQDWIRAISAEGGVPGFPAPADENRVPEDRIDTRENLINLVTHLMFRCGPQHSAVNNGQFDAYGYIPAGPGTVFSKLLDEPGVVTEADVFRSLPTRDMSLEQTAMVWVLSLPTRRNILYTGEFPDFDPSLSHDVVEAIAALRRRLYAISHDINVRNSRATTPYCYLDPQNVSRSTDV